MDQAKLDSALAGAGLPGGAAVAGLVQLVGELAAAGVLDVDAVDRIRLAMIAEAETGQAPFLAKSTFKQGITRRFLSALPAEEA
jgi:hypothetical protein